MKTYKNIDEYISNFDSKIQKKLEIIRKLIQKLSPISTETISYGIPTFKLNGKNLIHFAGYKGHIGLYPGSAAIDFFKEDLTGYKLSKGTIQLPIDEELPINTIQKIIKYRIDNI